MSLIVMSLLVIAAAPDHSHLDTIFATPFSESLFTYIGIDSVLWHKKSSHWLVFLFLLGAGKINILPH